MSENRLEIITPKTQGSDGSSITNAYVDPNDTGENGYITWVLDTKVDQGGALSQTGFEIQYVLDSNPTYINTTGLIPSEEAKYPVIDLYSLSGHRSMEYIYYRVIVYAKYNDLSDNGEGIINSDAKLYTGVHCIIFKPKAGAVNYAKIYDGRKIQRYPVFDVLENEDSLAFNIEKPSLDGSLKIPLVDPQSPLAGAVNVKTPLGIKRWATEDNLTPDKWGTPETPIPNVDRVTRDTFTKYTLKNYAEFDTAYHKSYMEWGTDYTEALHHYEHEYAYDWGLGLEGVYKYSDPGVLDMYDGIYTYQSTYVSGSKYKDTSYTTMVGDTHNVRKHGYTYRKAVGDRYYYYAVKDQYYYQQGYTAARTVTKQGTYYLRHDYYDTRFGPLDGIKTIYYTELTPRMSAQTYTYKRFIGYSRRGRARYQLLTRTDYYASSWYYVVRSYQESFVYNGYYNVPMSVDTIWAYYYRVYSPAYMYYASFQSYMSAPQTYKYVSVYDPNKEYMARETYYYYKYIREGFSYLTYAVRDDLGYNGYYQVQTEGERYMESAIYRIRVDHPIDQTINTYRWTGNYVQNGYFYQFEYSENVYFEYVNHELKYSGNTETYTAVFRAIPQDPIFTYGQFMEVDKIISEQPVYYLRTYANRYPDPHDPNPDVWGYLDSHTYNKLISAATVYSIFYEPRLVYNEMEMYTVDVDGEQDFKTIHFRPENVDVEYDSYTVTEKYNHVYQEITEFDVRYSPSFIEGATSIDKDWPVYMYYSYENVSRSIPSHTFTYSKQVVSYGYPVSLMDAWEYTAETYSKNPRYEKEYVPWTYNTYQTIETKYQDYVSYQYRYYIRSNPVYFYYQYIYLIQEHNSVYQYKYYMELKGW